MRTIINKFHLVNNFVAKSFLACYFFTMTKTESMTIEQACRLLRVETDYQLSKTLGITYQAVRYWRTRRDGIVPRLWAWRVHQLRGMK